VLDWREIGGPVPAEAVADGFGSRLIRALADQHGGGFERQFSPTGVVCRLRLSLRT
jgi:two-component sensor histidine kinase